MEWKYKSYRKRARVKWWHTKVSIWVHHTNRWQKKWFAAGVHSEICCFYITSEETLVGLRACLNLFVNCMNECQIYNCSLHTWWLHTTKMSIKKSWKQNSLRGLSNSLRPRVSKSNIPRNHLKTPYLWSTPTSIGIN